jgi:hypothetical protein
MLREWRRCSEYTSLVGFGGFSLKTIGGWFSALGLKTKCGRFGGLSLKTTDRRFLGLGLKTRLEFWQKLVVACGVIVKLALRQSKAMKSAWSLDAPIKT